MVVDTEEEDEVAVAVGMVAEEVDMVGAVAATAHPILVVVGRDVRGIGAARTAANTATRRAGRAGSAVPSNLDWAVAVLPWAAAPVRGPATGRAPSAVIIVTRRARTVGGATPKNPMMVAWAAAWVAAWAVGWAVRSQMAWVV